MVREHSLQLSYMLSVEDTSSSKLREHEAPNVQSLNSKSNYFVPQSIAVALGHNLQHECR